MPRESRALYSLNPPDFSSPHQSSSWAVPVSPASTAASLAALAPASSPAKARPLHLRRRRALLQTTDDEPGGLASPTSPKAIRAQASVAAAITGASPSEASLVELNSGSPHPASEVGGGDATGGAMEAAAEDARVAAVAAAAADPTVPLKEGGEVPATGPIPAALSERLQQEDADEPPPVGPGVSLFLEEKEGAAASPLPGPAPVVEAVGPDPPPPHTPPHAPRGGMSSSYRESMTTAALPGARAFAATKPLPLSASPAPSGLGPVFAASLPAALPAPQEHGSGPAGRAAAVGGTDICAAPGGKLVVVTADAVAVRDAATGALLAGPTPLSAFFQDASGGTYTSPRCVYDGAADRLGERRTYLAALRAPAGHQASGGRGTGAANPAGEPAARLVVAATVDGGAGDPTGAWAGPFMVSVDGIDRRGAAGGTKLPGAAACPTLGCTARGLALGVDAHGLWATTELWTPEVSVGAGAPALVGPSALVGPLAVGLSKAGLKTSSPSRPAAAVLTGFPLWTAHGGLAPSSTEPWSVHDTRAGGTVFFAGVGGGQVGVWALHHTAALRAGLTPTSASASPPPVPFVSPTPFLVDRTRAAEDVPASFSAGIQRPSSLGLIGGSTARTAPLDPASPRRLARLALADGALWFASAAPVFAGGLSPTLGTAFFVVRPDVGSLGLRPASTAVQQTGWVAVDGAATLAPTVAAGRDGVGVVALALASPAFEPSFAYATISATGGPSAVKIVAAGQPASATPAVALARAASTISTDTSVGAVQAFSFGSGDSPAPPPTPPETTTRTPAIAAGGAHAGALDSIAVGLFSGAVSTPTGDAFWVGGRRAACGGGAGECVPAWATTVGLVTVAAEVV